MCVLLSKEICIIYLAFFNNIYRTYSRIWKYTVTNGVLLIHQLKTYLLATYTAPGTILGERCSRENKEEKWIIGCMVERVSMSMGWSGVNG